IVRAERWKIGQLKPGDRVRFRCVSFGEARERERAQSEWIRTLSAQGAFATTATQSIARSNVRQSRSEAILSSTAAHGERPAVVYRQAGDEYLLIEYGPNVLDLALRFRVHALMECLQRERIEGLRELTPGIRSLQVHFDSSVLSQARLLDVLAAAEEALPSLAKIEVPSRIVHLPLSWDDPATRLAIEKYMQSVRRDAPWCPSNIEFIRRINGLDSIEDVKKIVFDASYVVMGLGDVYLGAPVATPLDPRHRLVTTKYNPARTWTAENSVGIGVSYMCVDGMEGPGGYQFVGRTLQMWNRHRATTEFTQPWLLRFFDQIRFFPVSAEQLETIRHDFPRGRYPLRIEETTFRLRDYQQFLATESDSIAQFTGRRETAFAEELQRWIDSGQIHFDSQMAQDQGEADTDLPEGCMAIDSHVAGNIWQMLVKPGDTIAAGQTIAVLESMKMEIDVVSPVPGTVHAINRAEGSAVNAGQALIVIREH